MASGHVNRTYSRTHGSTDQACNVKFFLPTQNHPYMHEADLPGPI
jgi:hypothetical protein